MSTFGVMQADIADELNKTNLGPQIKRAICTAMRRYRDRRLKFNYSSSTFTSSDGQALYPLPSGYIGDDMVEVLDGSYRDTLTKRDYSWMVEQDNHDSHKSEPRTYAIIDGDNMRLFPTPDATANTASGNYTFLVHAHVDLNAPGASDAITICASDSVSNSWMTDGYDLIILEAKMWIYTNVLRGPEAKQEAAFLAPERDRALKTLIREYQRAVASGQMQSSG